MSVYNVETDAEPAIETVEILGIPFAKITQKEGEKIIKQFLGEKNNRIVVTPNPEGVMQARRNHAFAAALRSADLSLADGTGIVLASKFLRRKLPGRVRGVDTTLALLESLSQVCDDEQKNFTIFLLGGRPGVPEKAKENIEKNFTNVKVAGFHHGFFSDQSTGSHDSSQVVSEEQEILREIACVKPDILLVCMGMPRAELWAAAHKDLPVGVTMCVGGTIDILAGTVKLTPTWLRVIGMEWLWRLIRQPSRFRRMFDIPRFVGAVVVNKFSRKT